MLYTPKWTNYFISLAATVAGQSNCCRRKVGAVLVQGKRIIATGYNGVPSGFDNCDGTCYAPRRQSGSNFDALPCMHAEQNAIHQCATYGIPTNGASLFVTIAPCNRCILSAISAGVKAIYYKDYYQLDEQGENLRTFLLTQAKGFQVFQV
jgi:dCMP deaminase